MSPLTLPVSDPTREIKRQMWRSVMRRARRSSSVGVPRMGVLAAIAAANFAAISPCEVMVDGRWGEVLFSR